MGMHPFITGLDQLTIEELQAKVSDLQKKMTYASRSSNTFLLNQMRLALSDYSEAIERKLQAQMAGNTDTAHIMDKIDIS